MLNAVACFKDNPIITNVLTRLIMKIFVKNIRGHAHPAVGMSLLPFNEFVEIEAEFIIR